MTVFSNLSCYTKTGLKKDNFFQILDSKKDKYMFQKTHERIKDCLLINFYKVMCLSETNFLFENPKH